MTVVPTAAALRFVGAPTWEALSGQAGHRPTCGRTSPRCPTCGSARRPTSSSWPRRPPTCWPRPPHGMADDLLTATLLTARCPVVLAPAMHTEMWEHPATRANVATLTARGVHVVLAGLRPPHRRRHRPGSPARARGHLRASAGGCSLTGPATSPGPPGAGARVVVSAGGTREPLDPVRFLGNRSSGKQGYALAQVAAPARRRGDARGRQRRAAPPRRASSVVTVGIGAGARGRGEAGRRAAPTSS